MITGKQSDENIVLADGKIVLSEDGAKQLIHELKNVFHIKED